MVEVIYEYINTARSVEDILKATKIVLLLKCDFAKAFDSLLEKRIGQSIASPLSTREEVQGDNRAKKNASDLGNLQELPNHSRSFQKSNNTSAANVVTSISVLDMWLDIRERALVQALQTFPKETNQRWERVAVAVPGKTVSQCKQKFALMKEKLRNSNVPVKNTAKSDNLQESSSQTENYQNSRG